MLSRLRQNWESNCGSIITCFWRVPWFAIRRLERELLSVKPACQGALWLNCFLSILLLWLWWCLWPVIQCWYDVTLTAEINVSIMAFRSTVLLTTVQQDESTQYICIKTHTWIWSSNSKRTADCISEQSVVCIWRIHHEPGKFATLQRIFKSHACADTLETMSYSLQIPVPSLFKSVLGASSQGNVSDNQLISESRDLQPSQRFYGQTKWHVYIAIYCMRRQMFIATANCEHECSCCEWQSHSFAIFHNSPDWHRHTDANKCFIQRVYECIKIKTMLH